jgi:hypothetical protein
MPFLPTNATLGTHEELEEFFYAITYTNIFGTSFPVTITTSMPNTSVTVSSNTIYGFYSNVFTANTIRYRTKTNTLEESTTWDDIETAIINNAVLEIYDWSPDPTISKTYYYTAHANNESKEYNIVVLNNWDTGKNNLLYYLDRTKRVYIPEFGAGIQWINNKGEVVIWINNNTADSSVTWITG